MRIYAIQPEIQVQLEAALQASIDPQRHCPIAIRR